MTTESIKPNILRANYPWVIMLACVLIMGAGSGILSSTLGVLIRPVCLDLGFMRSKFSLYATITSLTQVVLMPVFGSLFQRFGFRRVAFISALFCGCALFGYSISSSLWLFYFFAFVCGLFINGFTTMAIGILMNDWFIDRRGFALGIAYCGSGLFSSIMIPVSNSIIEAFGWRWAYRFLGCVCLGILLPIILFVVRDKPSNMGMSPYMDTSSKSHPSIKKDQDSGLMRDQAIKTATFWLLFASCFGITLCQAGPHTNTVSFLNDIGYSSTYAASVSSVYMILLTVCKVTMGFIFDKLGSLKGSLLVGISCVLFPIIALFAKSPGVPWIYAGFLAIASSGCTVMATVLTTNYFGRKDFSRIYSLISMAVYAGVAISSPAFGLVFDLTGGYNTAWFIIAGIGIVLCITLTVSAYLSKSLKFN